MDIFESHLVDVLNIVGHAAVLFALHPVSADIEEAISRSFAPQDDPCFYFALSLAEFFERKAFGLGTLLQLGDSLKICLCIKRLAAHP